MLILLILVLTRHSSAIFDSIELSIESGHFDNFEWFGFLEKGSIDIKFDFTSNQSINSDFYLCKPAQYESFKSEFKCRREAVICDRAYQFKTENNSLAYHYKKTINEFITYLFILTACGNDTLNVSLEYTITNPDEQLSSGVFEIKYIMLGCFSGWVCLLFAWLVIWAFTKHKYPNIIQILLIANCTFWATFTLITYIYLLNFSEQGSPDSELYEISTWLLLASESCYLSILQVISSGLGIRKPNLQKIPIMKVVLNILILFICYLLYKFIGDKILYFLSFYYFILLIFYMIDINRILNEIQKFMQEMNNLGEEIIESPEWHQLRMYNIFRISLVIFLLGLAASSAIYDYFYYMPWVSIGSHVFLIFNSSLILFLYFRFRANSPYTLSERIIRNQA